MKDFPNSFWAAIFICIACSVAVIALLVKDKTDTTAVITMASSIITGAFGYIQGVKDGAHSVQVPLQPPSPNSPAQTTTVSVGPVAPTQPVEPAKASE